MTSEVDRSTIEGLPRGGLPSAAPWRSPFSGSLLPTEAEGGGLEPNRGAGGRRRLRVAGPDAQHREVGGDDRQPQHEAHGTQAPDGGSDAPPGHAPVGTAGVGRILTTTADARGDAPTGTVTAWWSILGP